MSTVSIQKQMRALVDQFETGLLDQDEYRRLRSSLLERAASGEYEAPEVSSVTRPRQSVEAQRKQTIPEEVQRKSEPVQRPVEKTRANESTTGSIGKWVILGALAVVIAAGGLWFFSQKDSERPAEEAIIAPVGSAEVGPMEELTTEFMQLDDWTPRVVREFSLSWQDFTPEQRKQAESSIWYRRFVRDLRDRLRLAELASDSVANDRAISISTLATEMQIEVESRFAETRNVSAVKAAAEANNRAIAERQRKVQLKQQEEADAQELAVQSVPVLDSQSSVAQNSEGASSSVDSTQQQVASKPASVNSLETDAPVATPEANTQTDQVDITREAETLDAAEVVISTSLNNTEDVTVPDSEEGISQTNSPAAPVSSSSTPIEVVDPKVKTRESPGSSGCTLSRLATRLRFCRDTLGDSSIGPKLALIRAGSFQMGSTKTAMEQPVRTVTMAKGYAIGASEVTVAEYARYCESTGAYCPENPWVSSSMPVVSVSHEDATAYTRWLSTQTGQVYRLPTEAEWEYATRAGSDSVYPFGDTLSPDQAHYSSMRRQTQPLPANSGQSVPNKFGLKHSIGNVGEWVEDEWHDDYSGAPVNGDAFGSAQNGQGVVRGGSYADGPGALRSAARSSRAANTRDQRTGFRILRELE